LNLELKRRNKTFLETQLFEILRGPLPSLLLDGGTNNKKGWNKFMRTRAEVNKSKKRNPEKFDTLTNKITTDLNKLEKAVLVYRPNSR
jgi:hypothetical protein